MGGSSTDTDVTPPPSVVTPGNHDGVHQGHRALVDQARRRAQSEDPASPLRVVALTFEPHPTYFVAPHRAPPLLTSHARRAELLRGAGADHVHVQRFDAAFAALSPEQFVSTVLVGQLGARAVVVGRDFRFGARRAGDVDMLRQIGAELGVDVEIVDPVVLDGKPISSSRIRAELAKGDVGRAAVMLTRVHEVTRKVVRGDARGRTIGFPTANLELTGFMPPADGVYAVVARVLTGKPSGLLHGVANLGVRPTLSAGRSVEVHLLDYEGELYDEQLRVGFVARLRGEQRFDGIDALRLQISKDVQAGRDALAAADPRWLEWI